MQSDAELVIVIVTYNSAHVVGDLLGSLGDALAGVRAETVVVDNGSTDGTVALLRARDDVTLILSSNIGYAGGVNLGARRFSSAPAILVLNPDLRLQPGSVGPLLAALAQPRTGIAAPQVRNADGSLFHSLRREPAILRAIGLNFTARPAFSEYIGRDEDYDQPCTVDWALGAALLVSRECFDLLCGWDESFFLYSEETDFCLRARDLGYVTRYEPSSVVTHIGGQSGRNRATHSMMVINRVRLYRRRHGAAASWLFWGVSVASELSWVARGRRESRASLRALVRPSYRPPELASSDRLLPV